MVCGIVLFTATNGLLGRGSRQRERRCERDIVIAISTNEEAIAIWYHVAICNHNLAAWDQTIDDLSSYRLAEA